MSRKNWSEYRRQEEIERLMNKIEEAEKKLDHLMSEDWREPEVK